MQCCSKELRVVDICTSYPQLYTQYLDCWLSDLLRCELKMKLLEVEEGTRPSAPASDATACCFPVYTHYALHEVVIRPRQHHSYSLRMTMMRCNTYMFSINW